MKKLSIITCALLCTILVTALVGAEMTFLRMRDNGKEIRVKVGEVITLSLEFQAGTGYSWEFNHLDEKHFQVTYLESLPMANPNLMGGPMLQSWRLKAIAPGDAKISLDYLRPWEGRAKAIKHFEVKVRIQ
jgi:predicted secreted protein